MSRPERLHVPGGRYFVVDSFHASEVLVAAPGRMHSEAELRQLAAHRIQYELQLAYAITTMVSARRYPLLAAKLRAARDPDRQGTARTRHAQPARPFLALSSQVRRSSPSPYTPAATAPGWSSLECTVDLWRDICWRPVRAGLCKHPTEYPHTTIHYALNGSTPRFLARSRVLAWFQQRQHHPRTQLLSFFSAAPTPEFTALLVGLASRPPNHRP